MSNNERFRGLSDIPKPLSKEETYIYFLKYKNGDLEAREQIILHNILLVLNRIWGKFFQAPYDKEELFSIGLIGLINSIDTYDIDKKFEFTTYAVKCIDNEILKFLRKESKCATNESIYTPISIGSEDRVLEDIIEDVDSDFVSKYEDKITYDILWKVICDLPSVDRKMILLYFGFVDDKMYSQKELASMFNISQSNVSMRLRKILKEVRGQLKDVDLVDTSNLEIKKYKRIVKK